MKKKENGQSVGKGGLPDRDGNVTLDACIMDHKKLWLCRIYADIKHAISVARMVMENTPRYVSWGWSKTLHFNGV